MKTQWVVSAVEAVLEVVVLGKSLLVELVDEVVPVVVESDVVAVVAVVAVVCVVEVPDVVAEVVVVGAVSLSVSLLHRIMNADRVTHTIRKKKFDFIRSGFCLLKMPPI